MLFVWDMIFVSAHNTRRYPAQVGLIDDQLFGTEHWSHQMFYPVVQSQREHTALKFGGGAYVERRHRFQIIEGATHDHTEVSSTRPNAIG